MPAYRIYYVERPVSGGVTVDPRDLLGGGGTPGESEWEENIDADSVPEALEKFFLDHAGDRTEVRIIEEDGSSRNIGADEPIDPDRTYIWMEEGSLMEYQGLSEATPGMVTCPLCDGTGEVEESVAEEYEGKG